MLAYTLQSWLIMAMMVALHASPGTSYREYTPDAVADPEIQETNESDQIDDAYTKYNSAYHRRMACGHNALFLFLKLRGFPASMADIESELGPRNNTMRSMLDLRDAAWSLGCPTAIRAVAATEIANLDFPVVVRGSSGRPLTGPDANHKHFVVLLGVSGERLRLVDPSSGHIDSHTLAWTLSAGGDLTILTPTSNSSVHVYTTGAVIIAIMVFTLGKSAFTGSLLAQRRVNIATALFCASTLLVKTSACGAQSTDTEGKLLWRSKDYSPVNACCLLLYTSGVYPDYREVADAIGDSGVVRLGTLSDLCSDYSCNVSTRQLTPEDLPRVALPYLAIMNDQQGGQAFAFVFNADQNSVYFIDCASCQWHQMLNADFVRDWSSYIVSPTKMTPVYYRYIALGLVLTILYCLYIMANRRRPGVAAQTSNAPPPARLP